MARSKTRYARLRPKDCGINEAAWREIISAWENGLSDREAAFRACRDSNLHITEAQVKRMVKNYPEVASLKEFLQADVISRAKLNIADNIREGNISTSKWYLERKAADEFSSKAAVALDGAVVELSVEEKKAEMDEFLKRFDTEKDVVTDEPVSEDANDGES